jgi:hypothetical protein
MSVFFDEYNDDITPDPPSQADINDYLDDNPVYDDDDDDYDEEEAYFG